MNVDRQGGNISDRSVIELLWKYMNRKGWKMTGHWEKPLVGHPLDWAENQQVG